MTARQKCKRGLLLLLVLAAEYLLCRFGLFSLHGMKDWPGLLACAVLVIGAILTRSELWGGDIGLLAGYLLGLFAGLLLHRAGPYGTDNLPVIWLMVMLFSGATGVWVDILRLWRRRHRD